MTGPALDLGTLLVPVAGTADDRPALALAMAVAGRSGAHVEVLHVRADPLAVIPFVGAGGTAAMVQGMADSAARDAADRAARARAAFEDAAHGRAGKGRRGGPAASVEWREETGREREWVMRRGRLADVVVAARPTDPDDAGHEAMLEAALFGCGRALLLAPPQLPEAPGSRIAVAWNGSAPAARAVGEATAFLRAAGEVVVLAVEERGAVPADPEELAAALARRGIAARVHVAGAGDRGPGAALLGAAAALGCDLAVMGAYGHSRLREMVLGGVTREVLRTAGLPVLMSH